MSKKRPGIKGKSRKARDRAFARREQIERKRRVQRLRAQAQRGEVVVTKNDDGQIVGVTRQDEEGRILKVIATNTPTGGETFAVGA